MGETPDKYEGTVRYGLTCETTGHFQPEIRTFFSAELVLIEAKI